MAKQFDKGDQFCSYATAEYSCHYYETPTGYGFVAMGSPQLQNLQESLRKFY